MKKHQLSTWLGLCAAITIFEVAALSTAANAKNCSAYNSSVVTSVRQRNVPIGNILINNNYGSNPQNGSVSIRLYHSDTPDRVFSTGSFAGGESATFSTQGQKIVIGGDWGIQIVFGNGVTSCIYPVADVGRFENGKYVVIATDIYKGNISSQPVTQQLTAALRKIPSKYQPLPTADYVTFRYDPSSLEIGVRLGSAVLRNEIEKIPEQRLKYTNYNRHVIKWFKYKGIDVSRRQILVGFRYRYEKLEDRPWPLKGRFTVYDNAANVDVGVNLEVKNKQLDGNVYVRHVESDWASGVLGLAQNTYEIMFGTLTFLADGKFIRPSDFAATVAPGVINASTTDRRNLSRFFGELNDLNSKGVIYLKRIDYDSQGVWYQFSIDESILAQSASRLESMLNSWANR
jgi:hypothetical protein